MQFKNVIGHQSIKQRIIQSVNGNRISHAQLFLGNAGFGTLPLALAFARYVSCTNKGAEDACGQCASCKKMDKFIHPDVHFAFPVTTTKTITANPISDKFLAQWRSFLLQNPYRDLNQWYNYIGTEKQGAIQKDEAYEIIKKLNLKTYEGDYKIMIIWMPEKMNESAANKLLKLIEEPPPKTLFLLIAESTEKILQTILSRTQMLNVPAIDADDLKASLQGRYSDLPEMDLNSYIKLASGNYNVVLSLISESEENKYNFEQFTSLVRNCFARKLPEILLWAEEMANNGREKQKTFLEYALHLFRENFIINLNNGKLSEVNTITKFESEFSLKFSKFVNDNNIFQINQEINNAYFHIERNVNSKIVLFDFSLKLLKLLNINKV